MVPKIPLGFLMKSIPNAKFYESIDVFVRELLEANPDTIKKTLVVDLDERRFMVSAHFKENPEWDYLTKISGAEDAVGCIREYLAALRDTGFKVETEFYSLSVH